MNSIDYFFNQILWLPFSPSQLRYEKTQFLPKYISLPVPRFFLMDGWDELSILMVRVLQDLLSAAADCAFLLLTKAPPL